MQFRFIFLSIFIFFSVQTKASHIVGGDLQYEYLGNDLYEITLYLYKDCADYVNDNGTIGTPVDFQPIYSPIGPQLSPWDYARVFIHTSAGLLDSVYFTSIDTIDIPVNNPNPCLQITEDLCIKRATYKVQVSLPSLVGGYHLSFQDCCRNINTTNIVDPFNTGITIPAFIPERNTFGDNSNPLINLYPPLVICKGQEINLSQMATDPDGDDLVYGLTTPMDGDEQYPYPPPYMDVQWEVGYSSSMPLTANPPLAIDATTGLLTGVPTLEGTYIVGISIKEYRNGVLLSESIRDFRFLILECSLTEASFPQESQICNGLEVDFVNNSSFAMDYFWDFGDQSVTTDTSSEAAPSYTYPAPGIYSVMLIANPGLLCADTSFISFLLKDQLYPEIDSLPIICFEDNSYDFSFSGFYPVSTTTIVWDFGPDADPQNANVAEPEGVHFESDDEQMIIVTLYLDSCQNSDTLFFTPEPEVLAQPDGPINGCDSLDLTLSPIPYNANYTYDWIINNDTFFETDFPSILLGEGQYDVQLTTTSEIDCETTIDLVDYITIHSLPIAGFALTDTIFEEGDIIGLIDQSINATEVDYLINETDYISNQNPNFTAGVPGFYTITQTVDNPGNCPDEHTIEIEVEPSFAIVFPNVFSPNGDNLNDYFSPKHFKVKSYTMKVYDRWGEMVFNGDKPKPEHRWYGDRINKDLSDQAVYYYQCIYTTNRDLIFEHEGTVTLLK